MSLLPRTITWNFPRIKRERAEKEREGREREKRCYFCGQQNGNEICKVLLLLLLPFENILRENTIYWALTAAAAAAAPAFEWTKILEEKWGKI